MATTVKFEWPPGTVLATRNFAPGSQLRIGGHVTGLLGLGEPFQSISMDISGEGFNPITAQALTDVLGDFWFDITLPKVGGQATVKIVSSFTVSGQDVVTIPIDIGSDQPGPLPTPQEAGGWLANVGTAVFVGLLILGAIYVFRSTPSREPQRQRSAA